jgi:prevent-host-death family protein
MPRTVTIEEAETKLSELLHAVEAGEEVVIARDSKPIAKITSVPADDIVARRLAGRGSLAGKFQLPPDNVLIGPLSDEDLEEAFGKEAAELFK